MANAELEAKWKPVLRWTPEFQQAIARVFLEEGVQVSLARMCAHCGIETGYTGDPKSRSAGPGNCCPRPGVDCTPDCYFYGLFQIFWPTFSGVDFSKLYDPAYNSYVGCRMLAIAFKECGDWVSASNKFFSGSCALNGTIDPNTGTSDGQYQKRMESNLAELKQIGVGDDTANPKPLPKTGNGNTPTDDKKCVGIGDKQFCLPDTNPLDNPCVDVFGLHLCFAGTSAPDLPGNPADIVKNMIDQWLPRIALIVVGIVILGIGLFVVSV